MGGPGWGLRAYLPHPTLSRWERATAGAIIGRRSNGRRRHSGIPPSSPLTLRHSRESGNPLPALSVRRGWREMGWLVVGGVSPSPNPLPLGEGYGWRPYRAAFQRPPPSFRHTPVIPAYPPSFLRKRVIHCRPYRCAGVGGGGAGWWFWAYLPHLTLSRWERATAGAIIGRRSNGRRRHSGPRRNPEPRLVPALRKAGGWIPACAGMTVLGLAGGFSLAVLPTISRRTTPQLIIDY